MSLAISRKVVELASFSLQISVTVSGHLFARKLSLAMFEAIVKIHVFTVLSAQEVSNFKDALMKVSCIISSESSILAVILKRYDFN